MPVHILTAKYRINYFIIALCINYAASLSWDLIRNIFTFRPLAGSSRSGRESDARGRPQGKVGAREWGSPKEFGEYEGEFKGNFKEDEENLVCEISTSLRE